MYSAHEQQFLACYCWQGFIKGASCKCKNTLQEWITALQMDVTENPGKICVLKVFISWKFWSIHRNITVNSGLPVCDAASLGRWSLAAFFMYLKPFKIKATNSFVMSGLTYQATQHHTTSHKTIILARLKDWRNFLVINNWHFVFISRWSPTYKCFLIYSCPQVNLK